ncbi:MAG: hypothetical protein CM1200mP14_03280 [Gammaproteobacteria bacterium]|nr:MAG: hypothetical protein CM1200mP14_03280 [Gammaproteobacteria bacterium]
MRQKLHSVLVRVFSSPGDEARQAIVNTGASGYMPILGNEVYAGGGFPLILDCVGSRQTMSKHCALQRPEAES